MKPLNQLDIRHFKQQVADDEKTLEAKRQELDTLRRSIRALDIQMKKISFEIQHKQVEERRLDVEVSTLNSQHLRKQRELKQLMHQLRESGRFDLGGY